MAVCSIDASCRNHALFTKFSRSDSRKPLICVSHRHTHTWLTHIVHSRPLCGRCQVTRRSEIRPLHLHTAARRRSKETESRADFQLMTSPVCVCVYACVCGGAEVTYLSSFPKDDKSIMSSFVDAVSSIN